MKVAKINYNILEEILENLEIIPPNIDFYQYIDISEFDPQPIIGQKYNGSGFVNDVKIISKTKFRDRFTITERIAIDNLNSNNTLPDPVKELFNTIIKDFENADEGIDIMRTDVQYAVFQFEEYGLISTGRAQQVLT